MECCHAVSLVFEVLSVSGCLYFSHPDCIGNHTVNVVNENDETIANFHKQLPSNTDRSFDIACEESTLKSTADDARAPTGLKIRPIQGAVLLRIECHASGLGGEATFGLTVQ